MQDGIQPLQLLSLRWIMLSGVCAAMPLSATEQMLQDVGRAAYPQVGPERIRAEIEYLESAGLVTVARSEIRPWSAKPTQKGRDVADLCHRRSRGHFPPAAAPSALMPPRSSVFRLDVATRAELERRIAAAGYGAYEDHAAWLAERGEAITRSALQRFGKRLKLRAEREGEAAHEAAATAIARIRHSAEIARAVSEADEDPLDMHERAAELCMARLCEIAATEDVDAKTLQAIARSLSATLHTVMGARGQRVEERKQAIANAKDKAATEARKGGLSPATAARIRAVIEGQGYR